MRSAAAAEWILSLVTPPDRASSTMGDLLEESPARGTLWFWSSVLRTACAHVWRDLSASPWRMVRLALWGWLAYMVLGWSSAVLTGMLYRACVGAARNAFPVWMLLIAPLSAVPFAVGWMLARRSQGRDLAAVFSAMCPIVLWPWLERLAGMQVGLRLDQQLAMDCAVMLFMAAGAILYRRRRIKRSVHA